MSKTGIINWVKEHIRVYIKMRDKDNGEGGDEDNDKIRDIRDVKEKAEVGIKIRWRF